MKTIYLGRNKKTEVTIMNADEVQEFLKDKTVYHHQINWVEKWNGVSDITNYFPYQGFTLPNEVILKGYQQFWDEKWPENRKYNRDTYPEKCLSTVTIEGKSIFDLPRYKITIKDGKTKMYYVTKL